MHGRQVIWREKGIAELQPIEVPQPAKDEVLVQSIVSLISPGTERAFFLGAPGAVFKFPNPPPGYSNVGEVTAVGEGVESVKVGDRIACPAGHLSHYTTPAASCLVLEPAISSEHATFFNLITIAMQAVRKSRVELGEPVVVIGAGMIGLFAMQLAKLQGALPVIIVDRDEGRARFATRLNADHAFAANDQLADQVATACAPTGPAVVIEASGTPPAVNLAFKLAGKFARVILLGSTRGDVDGVDVYRDVHYKGLTIIGAHNSTRPKQDSTGGRWTMNDDWRTTLRLLAAKRIVIDPLITDRYPAAQAVEAYDRLAKGDLTAQAMLLDWRA